MLETVLMPMIDAKTKNQWDRKLSDTVVLAS
jgi:hypothetical protein